MLKDNDNKNSFALFRLPGEQEPQLIIQTESIPQSKADYHLLNGLHGFVLAPFCIHQNSPLLVIRPDISVSGWSEIHKLLPHLKMNTYEPTIGEIDTFCSNDINQEEQEKADYQKAFNRFFEPLCENRFDKLVLARKHMQAIPEHFNTFETFEQACHVYPQLMVYLCYTPQTGYWFGCTPELLLKSDKEQPEIWETISLAGTQAIGQSSAEEFIWNEKNQKEQQIVTQYIEKQLRPMVNMMQIDGPHTIQAGPVAHLMTQFRFTLQKNIQAGDVLQSLHPTPAVCGLPLETANCFIGMNEELDRRYYAGFIGPLNTDGQTALYVNLRCMQILEHALCLYAGGGILSGSKMESEWDETKEKMKTIEKLLQHV